MNLQEEIFFNIIRINIRYYRSKRKLTQERLAELSNLSYDYINEIESLTKNKTFSIITLLRISNSLNVNVIDLLKWKGINIGNTKVYTFLICKIHQIIVSKLSIIILWIEKQMYLTN